MPISNLASTVLLTRSKHAILNMDNQNKNSDTLNTSMDLNGKTVVKLHCHTPLTVENKKIFCQNRFASRCSKHFCHAKNLKSTTVLISVHTHNCIRNGTCVLQKNSMENLYCFLILESPQFRRSHEWLVVASTFIKNLCLLLHLLELGQQFTGASAVHLIFIVVCALYQVGVSAKFKFLHVHALEEKCVCCAGRVMAGIKVHWLGWEVVMVWDR